MQENRPGENSFLKTIRDIIEKNLANEKFGVNELSREAGMSRSNLLRKVRKASGLSVSQLIRKVRLDHAMELLKEGHLNVSEVAWDVGFSSTSYFIKCFREHFGFPPGEIGKGILKDTDPETRVNKKGRRTALVVAFLAVLVTGYILLIDSPILKSKAPLEKSIAVLPFKNDSSDSTNVYFINGLMESILNNLQKIKELRVISRTSVEKYRNTSKTIPEIARELNVSYFVEGSGQKVGNEIFLNVQLIEASSDNHIWAAQYKRNIRDIFEIQKEISKSIAEEIKIIISPGLEQRMDKVPTENLVAYDHFLKALDQMKLGTEESFRDAIFNLDRAIELDDSFARAYSGLAMSYYFLDMYQYNKQYTQQINQYSDKALFFDPDLPQGHIAKALYYLNSGDKKAAVPYFEKALELNPNSTLALNFLSEYYANQYPDTQKYLEYSLKAIQLDIGTYDSLTASNTFLHLGNAFIQSGFTDEALSCINTSLEYNPENLYSEYVKAYVLFAKNKNLGSLNRKLINTFKKDTTRLDVVQEVGKSYYFMKDYKNSYNYYSEFIKARDKYNLNIFNVENAKIAFVFSQMGFKEESERLIENFKKYAEADESIYKEVNLATYYAYRGDLKKSLEHLKLFSAQDNYHYWTVLFLKLDPILADIVNLPEFKKIMKKIESKFWSQHNEIKSTLKLKELI